MNRSDTTPGWSPPDAEGLTRQQAYLAGNCVINYGAWMVSSLLGVAHETVSRSFSALAALGMVDVSDREVEILDMEGLKRFARSTRRHLDEPAVSRTRRPMAKRSASVRHAMGQPLDRKGPILANGQWPLNGIKGNVLDKGRVLGGRMASRTACTRCGSTTSSCSAM